MESSGGPITKDNTSIEYYGTIFAVAESYHERGVIWAGSDDGRVHVTRNDGDSWQDVTPSGLPEWAQINSIDIHPFERGGAYIAATRYKSDDFRPFLYRTTDWGQSWQRINNGIPDNEFTRVVRADPGRRGLLYAGTEKAIYYSTDDGGNWKSLQLNLPVSPITDLAVKESDLIAATQGRGYWILDDLSVLHQTDGDGENAVAHLFAPTPAYRLTAGGRADDAGNAGTNPETGVSFYYSLGEEPAPETGVSLSIFESRGAEPIWTWTRKQPPGDEEEEEPGPNAPPDTELLESEPGLNRFVWDLRYPGMERFDELIMWSDMREGPKAVPGSYRAELTVGDVTREVEFEVVADPRSSSTQADYRAQFEFITETRDLLSMAHVEIRKVRQLRSQLDVLTVRLEKEAESDSRAAELLEEVGVLGETITTIEEALYQTQNESRQDPLNYPIRLNNKLTSLMNTVDVGDARPTEGAIAVRAELSTAIRSELQQLEAVWEEHVPALNSEIQSMGIDLVSISEE
jgi:photosystem II stability/assembly factor-like uncharacterized protein